MPRPAVNRAHSRLLMNEKCRILQVGLPESLDLAIEERFRRAGWKSDWVQTAAEGLRALESGGFDVLLFATTVEDPLPERLAEESLRCQRAPAVLALSRQPDYSEACRLARFGVVDYLGIPEEEPFPLDWIEERVRLAWEDRAARDAAKHAEDAEPRLVGESELMRGVRRLIRIIAPRRSTILICGPTGTGKELAAKAIHGASPRAGHPLVTVNCGAIPESLMEAELLGHVKGAFSGAIANRTGRFEQAHKGTIFLDEVGEMPHDMQAKLLRVLQEREFQRVGSSETTTVDVRVVAATNRDLDEMVERGEFREDLYYRLNVIPISLPTLGRRLEDVPGLVDHLLERVCARERLPQKRLSADGLKRLTEYHWPGNVRQLENAVEKAVALSEERSMLYPSDFPLPRFSVQRGPGAAPEIQLPQAGLDFDAVVTELERSLLKQALNRSAGNKKQAADLLGIKRTTFAAKWRVLEKAAGA